MALSMSVSAGKHNARHNTDLAYRAKLPNVDPKLSSLMAMRPRRHHGVAAIAC